MPTSYTSLLGLALPVTGELSGTWGDTVNDYITQYLDAAVAGTQTISGSQVAVTLSKTTATSLSQAGSGATGSSQYQIINCTGNPASALAVTVPSASRAYLVLNNTSTNQTVTVKGAATTGVTVAAARAALIAWNGTDFELVATDDASKMNGILAVANGGTGSSTASGARTNLGATTVGDSFFTLTNPSAITFPRINADNTVSALNAADFRTATGSGTVTSVGGTGTVNGITLTGTVTSSGSLTLGGTLSNVNLATQVTGTLPVANGGTGAASLTANNVLLGNGTSALQVVAPGASGNVLTSNGTTWTSAALPPVAGTINLTASGSISSGAPVLLNSSGQAVVQTNTFSSATNGVSQISGSTTFGLNFTNTLSTSVKYCWGAADGQHRAFFNSSGTPRTVFGTNSFDGGSYTANSSQTPLSDIGYTPRFDNQNGFSNVLFSNVSGTFYWLMSEDTGACRVRLNWIKQTVSPSVGNATVSSVIVGGGAYSTNIDNAKNFELAISPNGDKIAVVWSTNQNRLLCAVATINSSTPSDLTWGTMLQVHGNNILNSNQFHMGVAWNANGNEFVIHYTRSPSITAYPAVALISVSGTTCTTQSTVFIDTADYASEASRHDVCFIPGANCYLFAFYTNSLVGGSATANSPYLVAATSSGTALTFGSIYDAYPYGSASDSRRNVCYVYSFPILTNGFMFQHSPMNDNLGQSDILEVGTISGTTISLVGGGQWISNGAQPLSSTYGYAAIGYVPTLGTQANVSGFTNSGPSGSCTINNTYRYASNQSNNFVGLSTASYTNGQTATITSIAGTNTVQSGLTPGANQWLQRSGIVYPIQSNVNVGLALSATSLLVKG